MSAWCRQEIWLFERSCRRHKSCEFDPWVGKMPWRRQPTPVFLPGESHGQRSLVGYCPCGRRESDTTERLSTNLDSLRSCCSLCVRFVAQARPTLCDPLDCEAHQAPPLFVGFPRQRCCSGLLFPSPGDLPDPGIEPASYRLSRQILYCWAKGRAVILIHL